MTPAVLAAAGPAHEFLPAPLWLLQVLHVLTLTLHFVAMNVLFGGLVIVLFGRFEDGWRHPVVQRIVRLLPVAMAATVTLGVAPLLFVQLVYGRPVYAASIVSAWFWLAIPFVVLGTYYLLYAASYAPAGARRKVVFLGLALAGLVYVSLTYSSVFSLAEREAAAKALYAADASGFAIHADLGAWGLRWLHMMVGAVTVGGFFVAWIGRDDEGAGRVGRRFLLVGMGASMVLGLGWLFTFEDLLSPFMKTAAPWYLLGSIVLALGALHFAFKRRMGPGALLLFLSLLGMVAVRQIARDLRLEGTFDPAAPAQRPQWDVFTIFLVSLVAAVLVVAWMLRIFFRAKAPEQAGA